MSILDEILAKKRDDLATQKTILPLSEVKARAQDAPPVRSLKRALTSQPFSIIGEVKERSPSAGEMDADNVARAIHVYNNSRAISAISVLTDAPFFGGSLERLWETRGQTRKPLLRKDFIIDEYQVWESRAFGADAILLMASVHAREPHRLSDLFFLARNLNLQCLVEIGMSSVHPEQQAEGIPPEADIWGVNSRKFDSKRFKVAFAARKLVGQTIGDVSTSADRHFDLRRLVPEDKVVVAESGIQSPEELQPLADAGYDAALIGTAFLRGPSFAGTKPNRVTLPTYVRNVVAAFERGVAQVTASTQRASRLAHQRA